MVTLYFIDAYDGRLQPLGRAAVGASALRAEPYVLPPQRPDGSIRRLRMVEGVNKSMGRCALCTG